MKNDYKFTRFEKVTMYISCSYTVPAESKNEAINIMRNSIENGNDHEYSNNDYKHDYNTIIPIDECWELDNDEVKF